MKFSNIATIIALATATAYASNTKDGKSQPPQIKVEDNEATNKAAKKITKAFRKVAAKNAAAKKTNAGTGTKSWYANPWYIGAGAVVLGALGGGVYMLVRKPSEETDL